MEKLKEIRILLLVLTLSVSMISCGDDDQEPIPEIEQEVYTMNSVSDPAISGTITFTKQDASTTTVKIEVTGTEAGISHPAHIHANSASQGGPIVIGLESVDGGTGISETTVSELDNGTPITYEQLLNFDGHANVHLSTSAMATLIAQGNVGSNSGGENNGDDDDDPGNGGNGY
jgi:hypothetical protein